MRKKIFLKDLDDQFLRDYADATSFSPKVIPYNSISYNWVYSPWRSQLRTAIYTLIKDHVERYGSLPTGSHNVCIAGKLYGLADNNRHVTVTFP